MINSLLSRVSEKKWLVYSSTSFWKTKRLRSKRIESIRPAARQSTSTASPSKSSASTWSSSKGKSLIDNSAVTIHHRLLLLAYPKCPSLTLVMIYIQPPSLYIWASSLSRAQLRCKTLRISLRRLKRWLSKVRLRLRILTHLSWVLQLAIATRTKTVSTICAPMPWKSSSLTSRGKALSRRTCGGLEAIVARSPRRSRPSKALMPASMSSVVVGSSQANLQPSLTPCKSTATWQCTSESRWRRRGLWRLLP